jgi:hypothetical protein
MKITPPRAPSPQEVSVTSDFIEVWNDGQFGWRIKYVTGILEHTLNPFRLGGDEFRDVVIGTVAVDMQLDKSIAAILIKPHLTDVQGGTEVEADLLQNRIDEVLGLLEMPYLAQQTIKIAIEYLRVHQFKFSRLNPVLKPDLEQRFRPQAADK